MSGAYAVSIRIDNNTRETLVYTNTWEWYGFTEQPAMNVRPWSRESNFAGGMYRSTRGVAAGTGGLVSYSLNTNLHLVLLWSNPAWGWFHNNYAMVRIVRGSAPTLDSNLAWSIYDSGEQIAQVDKGGMTIEVRTPPTAIFVALADHVAQVKGSIGNTRVTTAVFTLRELNLSS
jgi:hypothetical protein